MKLSENEHLKFIVSLDNNEVNPMLYNCTEWGDLYSEFGDFDNDPMILNGDEDLDGDGQGAGSALSLCSAFVPEGMVNNVPMSLNRECRK